ncbi:unnamed protein product [Ostreobium quekettii]|uniref:Uncharacterized protein n=1 Tax=Ostreobium quekettii TaxID=121088 RepID=A0A8S1J4R0_9CHLO|nr:unnamed protein product [Ostreobium quekettii]|eukprot:evm.model.scf_63.15 EVM.evm.TU.scf_63.15   scf_63:108436-108789(-)
MPDSVNFTEIAPLALLNATCFIGLMFSPPFCFETCTEHIKNCLRPLQIPVFSVAAASRKWEAHRICVAAQAMLCVAYGSMLHIHLCLVTFQWLRVQWVVHEAWACLLPTYHAAMLSS